MTTDQLARIMPHAPREWLDALVMQTALLLQTLDTPREQASFVAQLAHESAEFTRLEENLDYSASRLMAVWPRRFPNFEIAEQYEHNPRKLADFVYAGRLGNGPPDSGQGWLYHGRGPIQITGRDNYLMCGDWLGVDLLVHPELLLEPDTGCGSACWFWIFKHLDKYDDDLDVGAETRLINGSELGKAQRQLYFNKALAVFSE